MTVKDFYTMLFGEFNPFEFERYLGERLSCGDAAERKLERRTAAYMVHTFLCEVLKEADEPSIEPAFLLKDIYECPSCIRYIAQVYLKGIMPGRNQLFGVKDLVGEDEAEQIVARVLDKSKRSWTWI